jgi:CheY-like chemotaxis protein
MEKGKGWGRVMRKKVLVVDDEEAIRQFLSTLLLKWGYEVEEAGDGVQALEKLAKDNYDLLICDILMPNKNGWEVLKEMKSNPKIKEIPVIVLTGNKEDSDIVRGYELGVIYYMTKPFTTTQLLYELQRIFGETSE